MLKAFSTPRDKRRTVILLAACAVLATAAAWLGIDDSPPGLALAYLSAAALATAFAHPWRTPRPYRRLLYVSGFGLLASVVLHNVLYAVASVPDLPGLAQSVFTAGSVAFFFIGVLLCPPFIVVGVFGAVVTSLRRAES
jgi:hypothetical protein